MQVVIKLSLGSCATRRTARWEISATGGRATSDSSNSLSNSHNHRAAHGLGVEGWVGWKLSRPVYGAVLSLDTNSSSPGPATLLVRHLAQGSQGHCRGRSAAMPPFCRSG